MKIVRNVMWGAAAVLGALCATPTAMAQEAQEMGYFETPDQSAVEQRSVQAQAKKRGDHGIRLFVDVDLFRWTGLRVPVDNAFVSTTLKLSSITVGPSSLAIGAVTNLLSGGAGIALGERLVLNGAFGLGRFKSSDVDVKQTALRVLPDLDVLLLTSGVVRPYATAGLPLSFAINKGVGGDLRTFSMGPQFGIGALIGPVHAEMTFGALFGNSREDAQGVTTKQRITELTIAITAGASYWL